MIKDICLFVSCRRSNGGNKCECISRRVRETSGKHQTQTNLNPKEFSLGSRLEAGRSIACSKRSVGGMMSGKRARERLFYTHHSSCQSPLTGRLKHACHWSQPTNVSLCRILSNVGGSTLHASISTMRQRAPKPRSNDKGPPGLRLSK